MSDKNEIDQSLGERMRNGDREALSLLFTSQWEKLWRIVHFRMDRRLYGRVDPDDVLQEAYLSAVDRLHHFGKEKEILPLVWVRMILLQTLTDIHRHHLGVQKRSAEREIDYQGGFSPQSTALSLAAMFIGNHTSPSEAAVRTELYAQLENAITMMEPLDREVLALRHFEELGNNEVAEVLNIQPKAASIRYIRALKRLKIILESVKNLPQGDTE